MSATATAPAAGLSETQRAFAEAIAAGIAKGVQPSPAAHPEPKATMGQDITAGRKAGDVFELTATGELKYRPAADPVPTAEMGALLSPVEKALNGVNLPGGFEVGPLLLGGATGVVATELVNGLVPKSSSRKAGPFQANTIAKLAAIVLLATVGKKVMSKQSAYIAAGVLSAQLAADVLPLDTLTDKAIDLIRGKGKRGSGDAPQELYERSASQHAFVAPRTQSSDPLSRMWGGS